MVNIQNSSSFSIIDNLLPPIGSPVLAKQPLWLEDMKMFVMSEYKSKAGHRYIRGMRFSDQVAVVIEYSLWNNWTYLDAIEVYRFNGNNRELIGKKEYDKVFYDNAMVHSEVESILEQALISMTRMSGNMIDSKKIKGEVCKLAKDTERSFNRGEYPPITGVVRDLIEEGSKKTIDIYEDYD